MKLLIAKGTIKEDAAVDELYGRGADLKHESIRQLVKRLSKRLLDQNGPNVSRSNGHIKLVG